MDFSGALYVRHGGEEIKAYLCLFMCVIKHALQLEMVQDLSTEQFLLAFREFAARRSLPTIVVSDNASTYLSAADELRTLMQSPEVNRELGKRGVTWKCIPKRAPWWDGFWERMVGLTKASSTEEGFWETTRITLITIEMAMLHGRRIICLPHKAADDHELLILAMVRFVVMPSYLQPYCRISRNAGVMSTLHP